MPDTVVVFIRFPAIHTYIHLPPNIFLIVLPLLTDSFYFSFPKKKEKRKTKNESTSLSETNNPLE